MWIFSCVSCASYISLYLFCGIDGLSPNNLNRITGYNLNQQQQNSRKYPISKPYYLKYLNRINNSTNDDNVSQRKMFPLSKRYYEDYIKRLNKKNIEETNESFQNEEEYDELDGDFIDNFLDNMNSNKTFRVIIRKDSVNQLFADNIKGIAEGFEIDDEEGEQGEQGEQEENYYTIFQKGNRYGNGYENGYGNKKNGGKGQKSENFEVLTDFETNFTNVGGYESIKKELSQCIDLLKNYTKYSRFNVRVPKGLILEGPPGNGKTLLAKALAGEACTGFIAVSGSQFQEMYVGVGSSRIRELFKLAQNNIPCIIFIDEIDAVGRSRGSEKEMSSAERDSTLNELLVALDGFKTKPGVFLIGATNRADLLDAALLRPGRIDKRIFIGNPDEDARRAILNIHSVGKPRSHNVTMDDLVELTNGFSGAQIENLLNEAMLNALRYNREEFSQVDIDTVYNKILVGWQPSDHEFTQDTLEKICIHELGHAIVGLLARNHSKVKKVIINLSSPTSPGYTLFDKPNSNIFNRDTLLEHLMILLGGRIAEELFYGHASVSTGAISDFEEALTLANKMISYYGMGEKVIYPNNSEKYKEMIDNEITKLLQEAYTYSSSIIDNAKDFIHEASMLLKEKRVLTYEQLMDIIETDYSYLLHN